jgi:CubicO group peptidase (beta-lactamase class C family)
MTDANIDRLISATLDSAAPAIALAVYKDGQLRIHRAWGWIDPDKRQVPVTTATLFDLASLTKLFTITAFLALASAKNLPLNIPLGELLPEFVADTPRAIEGGQDPHTRQRLAALPHLEGQTVSPSEVRLYHLLTHTSGLPPWRDVYAFAPPPTDEDALSRTSRWQLALSRLVQYPFVDQIGVNVHYSDLGLMLLGEVVMRLNDSSLEKAVDEHVIRPLGLTDVIFNPVTDHNITLHSIAPTELDRTWRGRRVWGEVHDENAYSVGGVAGHAGLFGSALSVARFGLAWLQRDTFKISDEFWKQATIEQEKTGRERRGLGWMLQSSRDSSGGDRMSQRAFGHTGFTGTSLWIDPERNLVVSLMTNRVYWGRDGTAIHSLRRAVHDTVIEIT